MCWNLKRVILNSIGLIMVGDPQEKKTSTTIHIFWKKLLKRFMRMPYLRGSIHRVGVASFALNSIEHICMWNLLNCLPRNVKVNKDLIYRVSFKLRTMGPRGSGCHRKSDQLYSDSRLWR